jgi:hypothetical protein
MKPRTRVVELEDDQQTLWRPRAVKASSSIRRVVSVALAATLGLADEDAEGGCPVAVVDFVQPGVADGPQGFPFVDGKRRLVLRPRLLVKPVLFLLHRHGVRREIHRARGADVVDPTLVERQKVAAYRAQRHEIPLEIQDRTFCAFADHLRPRPLHLADC